jgi:hypothetical protein
MLLVLICFGQVVTAQDGEENKTQEIGNENSQSTECEQESESSLPEGENSQEEGKEDLQMPSYADGATWQEDAEVFQELKMRSIDELPDPKTAVYAQNRWILDEIKETKYFEVYAQVRSEWVKSIEVCLEVNQQEKRFEAEQGQFEVEDGSYNWKFRISYEELELEGSDGYLMTSLIAYQEQGEVVAQSTTYTTLASGVYDVYRNYVGEDLTVLEKNTRTTQVYYIHGTVWSKGSWDLYACATSVGTPYLYYYLTFQSYYLGDGYEHSVIRLRESTANPGRWLEIYGTVSIQGIDIIGTDNGNVNGLLSAKSTNFNEDTLQSVLTLKDCNIYNNSSWAVHGDRNSSVTLDNVKIMDCRGGVGSHGEITIRNSSISSGKYGKSESSSQSVGVHLSIPVNQNYSKFKRSLSLENVTIDTFYKGVEVRTTTLFVDDGIIGGNYESVTMDLGGENTRVTNCVYGVTFPDTQIPFKTNIGTMVKEVSNCTVAIYNGHPKTELTIQDIEGKQVQCGIQTYGKVQFSSGSLTECSKQAVLVESGGEFVQSGGTISDSQNAIGVEVKGTYRLLGGSVKNCKTGIHLISDGVVKVEGGMISDHLTFGILHEGKQLLLLGGMLSENANGVGEPCDIYLGDGAFIEWDSRETVTGTVKIDTKNHTLGTRLVKDLYYTENPSATLANGEAYPFAETIEAKYEVVAGENFVGRFGNRNQTIAGSLVLSEFYTMQYQDVSGLEVGGLPSSGKKYWQEAYQVSITIPWIVGFEDKPLFLGWDTNGDDEVDVASGTWIHQNQQMTFVVVWDLYPEISVHQEHTFYEGVDVYVSDLLEGVEATDCLDGDLTSSIRVVKIVYADGKLVNGEETVGETVVFEGGMKAQDQLDTWFEKMPKELSPITHTIVYEVTNSKGKTTQLEHTVKVNYNEPPEITAVDRYFTLEEAQSGVITKEELLSNAIEVGKLKVTDLEEDARDADYMKQAITLVSFSEEELVTLVGDATIRLEYEVRDQMGPNGQGKKATEICYLYIKEDGEVGEKDQEHHLRFIDETNYRKNEGKKVAELSEEEISSYNQNGGLHVDSYWYQKMEYKSVIERSFRANMEPIATYQFTDTQCKDAKEWVSTYGFASLLSTDALSRFYQEMVAPYKNDLK